MLWRTETVHLLALCALPKEVELLAPPPPPLCRYTASKASKPFFIYTGTPESPGLRAI